MNTKVAQSRRAFTLLEAVVAMGIASVLLVGALQATGTAAVYTTRSTERAKAGALADGLMSDILSLAYEESSSPVFGLESGEGSTSKSNYDDVDDFNGWVETPPQTAAGTAMSNMTGWKRSVTITRVTAANPTVASATESGVKSIVVTVSRNNIPVITRTALKTSAP